MGCGPSSAPYPPTNEPQKHPEPYGPNNNVPVGANPFGPPQQPHYAVNGAVVNPALQPQPEAPAAVLHGPPLPPVIPLRVLIAYHSSDRWSAKKIRDHLTKAFASDPSRGPAATDDVTLLDEAGTLAYRDGLLRWTDFVLLVVSYRFQKHPYCAELANYAKDLHKSIVSVVIDDYFDPTGSVGAIAKAAGSYWRIPHHNHVEELKLLADVSASVINELPLLKLSQTPKPSTGDGTSNNGNSASGVGDAVANTSPAKQVAAKISKDCRKIYLSLTPNGLATAELIRTARGVSNMGAEAKSLIGLEIINGAPDGSAGDNVLIKECKIFMPVLTSSYERSKSHQDQYDLARSCGKIIIPVKAEKFVPDGWLGLAIAGKLYYELLSQADAYKAHAHMPDSNPMNDFIVAVLTAMEQSPVKADSESEQTMLQNLQHEIDDYRAKLKTWPPEDTQKQLAQKTSQHPRKEELLPREPPKAPLTHINYDVTRMSFNPVPTLFDKNGEPVRQHFDCFLSYNWAVQAFVREVYMQLDMKSVKAWMDMWGGMLGNVNDSMATGIENATCIVVFLTEKYQESANCCFELKYAISLEKPLIFLVPEVMPPAIEWLKPHVNNSLCLGISSVADFSKTISGYPQINILSNAIQTLSRWKGQQPKLLRRDVSAKVYELEVLRENAINAMAKESGVGRYKTCTRCKANFDDDSAKGCTKHSAYFMGGQIMAGRWVCCQQTDKAGPGCQQTDHTTSTRQWKEMQGYAGCFQWDPA